MNILLGSNLQLNLSFFLISKRGKEATSVINIIIKARHIQQANEGRNIHFSINIRAALNDLLLLISILTGLLYLVGSLKNINQSILASFFKFSF